MTILAEALTRMAGELSQCATAFSAVEQERDYHRDLCKMLVTIIDRQSLTDEESVAVAGFERRLVGE